MVIVPAVISDYKEYKDLQTVVVAVTPILHEEVDIFYCVVIVYLAVIYLTLCYL